MNPAEKFFKKFRDLLNIPKYSDQHTNIEKIITFEETVKALYNYMDTDYRDNLIEWFDDLLDNDVNLLVKVLSNGLLLKSLECEIPSKTETAEAAKNFAYNCYCERLNNYRHKKGLHVPSINDPSYSSCPLTVFFQMNYSHQYFDQSVLMKHYDDIKDLPPFNNTFGLILEKILFEGSLISNEKFGKFRELLQDKPLDTLKQSARLWHLLGEIPQIQGIVSKGPGAGSYVATIYMKDPNTNQLPDIKQALTDELLTTIAYAECENWQKLVAILPELAANPDYPNVLTNVVQSLRNDCLFQEYTWPAIETYQFEIWTKKYWKGEESHFRAEIATQIRQFIGPDTTSSQAKKPVKTDLTNDQPWIQHPLGSKLFVLACIFNNWRQTRPTSEKISGAFSAIKNKTMDKTASDMRKHAEALVNQLLQECPMQQVKLLEWVLKQDVITEPLTPDPRNHNFTIHRTHTAIRLQAKLDVLRQRVEIAKQANEKTLGSKEKSHDAFSATKLGPQQMTTSSPSRSSSTANVTNASHHSNASAYADNSANRSHNNNATATIDSDSSTVEVPEANSTHNNAAYAVAGGSELPPAYTDGVNAPPQVQLSDPTPTTASTTSYKKILVKGNMNAEENTNVSDDNNSDATVAATEPESLEYEFPAPPEDGPKEKPEERVALLS